MTPEEIQAIAEENAKLKKTLEDTGKKLERMDYLEAEFKKSIEQRDKAKEEKRKAEEKRLAENNEFKTLAEQRAAEVEALAAERKALEENLSKYQERDMAKLNTLLEKIPEEKKALIKESFSLADRLDLAESFAEEAKKAAPGYRQPGEGNVLTREQEIAGAKTRAELEAVLAKHNRR